MISKTRCTQIISFWCIFFLCSCAQKKIKKKSISKPNIIFIMVDDMGYGDLGIYGQQSISTPHLDGLAQSGMRFTQFYSGSTVCAPARSVLMTGQHTGHTTVRGNINGHGGVVGLAGKVGRVSLEKEDITIAEVLKKAGYTTGITGKWGLAEPGTNGLPNDQGFDEWFGYLNQARAHNHFARYMWKDKELYQIPENFGNKKGVFTEDLFTDFALSFVERHANDEDPFFLYIPYTVPHEAYEIPNINTLYKDRGWTKEQKVYASMISKLDQDVGKIQNMLQKEGIEKNTLLMFTSDNGPEQRWKVFDSAGQFRGEKRDLYEGGIRVPMIVSMPGTVPGGEKNHTIGYFADIFPTLADFAGQKNRKNTNIDGISLKNVFTGDSIAENERDRVLYWEFHAQGGKQAVRYGPWKGVRLEVSEKGFHGKIELYNLDEDPSETKNVADKHPDIINRMKKLMRKNHEASDYFPFKFEMQKKGS